MTNYWNGATVREHEKLDGLWESGVKHYPVNGEFDDIYATDLNGAMSVYSYDDVLGYVTAQYKKVQAACCCYTGYQWRIWTWRTYASCKGCM